MTPTEFDKIITDRIGAIRNTLSTKALEYASVEDRLHNFKRAAATLKCAPEEALIGFWMKHVISILDMVDVLAKESSVTFIDVFKWDEKIGDAINYLVLLEGLVKERASKISVPKAVEDQHSEIPF